MELPQYLAAAASTWFIGFFPYFEIYVAVPAGFAAGLGWFDVFFWASLGNWMAIPFIDYGYSWLMRFQFMQTLSERSMGGKWERRIERHGAWLILFLTPAAGVWTIGIIAKALRYSRVKLWIYSAVSIWGTALVMALLMHMGIELFS